MSENLLISESYVNATEGHRYGDSSVYETFTDDLGTLYRSLVREWGRCTGRIYVDRDGNPPKAVGWVFVKRIPYDDSRDTYLREVWVTVHARQPETVTVQHFAEI